VHCAAPAQVYLAPPPPQNKRPEGGHTSRRAVRDTASVCMCGAGKKHEEANHHHTWPTQSHRLGPLEWFGLHCVQTAAWRCRNTKRGVQANSPASDSTPPQSSQTKARMATGSLVCGPCRHRSRCHRRDEQRCRLPWNSTGKNCRARGKARVRWPREAKNRKAVTKGTVRSQREIRWAEPASRGEIPSLLLSSG
jgi:hypothetical protein